MGRADRHSALLTAMFMSVYATSLPDGTRWQGAGPCEVVYGERGPLRLERVAPFGLIGVVAALLIAGKPLGFVAILGVLALVGMIVRNSVILVDQIDTEIAHGRAPWDAVIEATLHRFRPILLTAAAILGMIPIAPAVFWGPMAYSIMGGLAVATILTLVFSAGTLCGLVSYQGASVAASRTRRFFRPASADLLASSSLVRMRQQ